MDTMTVYNRRRHPTNAARDVERELFYEATQDKAFHDYVAGQFAYANPLDRGSPLPEEAAGRYYRDKVRAGLIDDPGLPPFPLIDRRQRALAILADVQAQRRDGYEVERDRERIDDRPADRFEDLEWHSLEPNFALGDGLRPFLERRTERQRLTLSLLHWQGASVREASAALGSDTSGSRSGSAQSNSRQAYKMLRKELLATYAPDDDPNDVPKRAPLHRFRRMPGDPGEVDPGPRVATSYDDPSTALPKPAPVRIRWIDPVVVPPITPAEFEARKAADRLDLEAAEAHYRRGFAAGFSFGPHRAWAIDCGDGPGPGDRSAGWPNRVEPTVRREPTDTPLSLPPPEPDRTPDRPWREPYPKHTQAEQAVADYLEWSWVHDAVADVMRRAPNKTDRGGGLYGVSRAFRKVWAGLIADGRRLGVQVVRIQGIR